MIDELVVPARYCGPPTSGNGGWTSGALATIVAGQTGGDGLGAATTVNLRQPPPLDSGMPVTREEATGTTTWTATFGGAVIAYASAHPGDTGAEGLEPVEPVGHDEAVAAAATYAGLREHPFATCFSCGTERPDGLRIFPGRVLDGTELGPGTRVAAPWTPDPSVADPANPDAATLAVTWAALDCAGAWSADFGERLMVLGRMTAIVDALPLIGEPHVVVAQHVGTDGRKTTTRATLYDADARVVGTADHLWISIDRDRFSGGN